MIIKFLEDLLHWNEEEEALDAEYEPFRDQLSPVSYTHLTLPTTCQV